MEGKNTTWRKDKPLERPMRKGELKKAGFGQRSPKRFAPKKKK